MNIHGVCLRLCSVVTLLTCCITPSIAQLNITLTASPPAPQKLGTPVTFTATIQNPMQGHTYDYQFSGKGSGPKAQILRDFNLPNSFTQASIAQEGTYVISVVVRDTTQQPYIVYAPVQIDYQLLPWIPPNDQVGAVNPSANPLVALFSGPACPAGRYARARFTNASTQVSAVTNANSCNPSVTSNFYVAGMRANTAYLMNWEQLDSKGILLASGPQLPFTTGSIPNTVVLPTFTVVQSPPPESQQYPMLLHAPLSFPVPYVPFATDLSGNVIWYSPFPFSILGHSEYNGNLMGLITPTPELHHQVLLELDLAGNIQQETNASILSEQLAALAIKQHQPVISVTSLHHEARRFAPNGNILVFGSRDIVSTMYQGGTQQNPVDIIGDVLMVLDPNMQLIWYWDSFTHEDLNRLATLNDICVKGQGGCPPFNQNFTQANDWLHSNSGQFAADGNIVISQRNQDWLLKINYNNGAGDGSVLWRMGNDGDFTLVNPLQTNCNNPGVAQWFTHQHDGEFQFNDTVLSGLQVLTVFDDGNTRRAFCDPNANSRGMLFFVAESTRLVYYDVTQLTGFSGALGSAQIMLYGDGSYNTSYDNGFLGTPQSPYSQTVESDQAGSIVYVLQVNGPYTYRTFRMRDLYSPPEL